MKSDEFRVKLIKHLDLIKFDLDRIIKLKQEHWDYPYISHLEWINNNINEDEYHLMITDNSDNIIAYLNLVNVKVVNVNESTTYVGIGNICVQIANSGKGFGKLILTLCNYYLNEMGMDGVLLCKPELLDFYKKFGWNQYVGEAYVLGDKLSNCLMSTKLISGSPLYINRNF